MTANQFFSEIKQICDRIDSNTVTESDLLDINSDNYHGKYLVHTPSNFIIGLMDVAYYDSGKGVIITAGSFEFNPTTVNRNISDGIFRVVEISEVIFQLSHQ